MAHVSLREVAQMRLNVPSNYQFLRGLKWIPLAVTELHLTSHYLPIAIRLNKGTPQLAAILDPAYVAQPPIDELGRWRPSYKPIAIRTIPMRLAGVSGKDPLQDLEVPADSPFLSADSGPPILGEDGNPSPWILSLRQLLIGLRDGQRSILPIVDQLLMADLLIPLQESGSSDEETEWQVVEPSRFARLGKHAAGALARHNFLTFDVAVASLFSQRALRAECLPKEEGDRAHHTAARPQSDIDAMRLGLGSLPVTLDEGELFSTEDLEALRLRPTSA